MADLEYAFASPTVIDPRDAEVIDTGSTGMTLRDYFAAAAMQGLLAAKIPDDRSIYTMAYVCADGMLKAREEL